MSKMYPQELLELLSIQFNKLSEWLRLAYIHYEHYPASHILCQRRPLLAREHRRKR